MKKLTGVFALSAFALAGTVFAGDTIYAIDNDASSDRIGTFDSDTPGAFTPLGVATGQGGFINGLEFDGSGNLYGSNGSRLFSVDTSDGSCTSVGSHGLGSRAFGGMAWDPSSSTMYGIDNDPFCGAASRIATIDLGSGAASIVCSHPTAICSVGLTVDASGTGYVQDVALDAIEVTDLGSCVVSSTQALVYDANYGQDITINTDTGDGYNVAFNLGTFIGEFYTWNPSTGAQSYVGILGGTGLTQMAGADVEASGDCLTMTVDPLIGGSNATWTVDGNAANAKGVVVWGLSLGSTVVNGTFGYCATFGINGVNQNRVVGFYTADGAGQGTVTKRIPRVNATVHTQAAQQGTCPDECVSNVDTQTIS